MAKKNRDGLQGAILEGFLYAREEVNPCHTNQNVPVPTPAAVGLLMASNTAPNIKRLLPNNTTSTNATPLPTNDMVVLGSVSVTVTSSRILFVRNARNKIGLPLCR